jgi:rod shape-determining protein MreD
MTRRPVPATEGADAVRVVVGLAVLVVAHFAVRPLVSGRVAIDFLAIAVLFLAIRVRPGAAAVAGLIAGTMVDAFTPSAFGAAALAFALVAFAASWSRRAFFGEHVALTGLFVLVGKWLYDALWLAAAGGLLQPDAGQFLMVWSPLSALCTAGTAMALTTLVAPLYRFRPA